LRRGAGERRLGKDDFAGAVAKLPRAHVARRLVESASARSALDILDETGVLDAARADYRAARVQPLEPLPIEFVV